MSSAVLLKSKVADNRWTRAAGKRWKDASTASKSIEATDDTKRSIAPPWLAVVGAFYRQQNLASEIGNAGTM